MVFKLSNMSDLYVPMLKWSVLDKVSKQNFRGVIIINNQNDDSDIQLQFKSVSSRGNVIGKTFKHCSDKVKV